MSKFLATAVSGLVLIGGALLPAQAADLYEPPVIEYEPPVEYRSFGGWYLRGHIGMTNQRSKSPYNILMEDPAIHEWLDKGGFGSAPLFGIGAGYQVNNYLRVDGIVEYRGKASFSALDRYDITGDGIWDGSNQYDAKKSEWLLMANAYADLGEFNGLVPYVGAGIGASRNTIHNFRDVNVANNGVAYADSASTWNFAWALHAGIGYKVTDAMTIDLGYSYVDLGKARTGDVRPFNGPGTIDNPTHFRNITSHDVKLGVRYSLN